MKYNWTLAIAGSDPSGGAGIQADIKAFTTLGVYCGAVVTCLTVQNSLGVREVKLLEASFVEKQLRTVFEDIDFSFIKIGMIGDEDIARVISKYIDGKTVVYDPVMLSKGGFPLTRKGNFKKINSCIMNKSTIITPNYPELLELVERKSREPVEAGRIILDKFLNLKGVLIKGGHYKEKENNVYDILLLREKGKIEVYYFKHRRIFTRNTHGTGCTLSSAISAFLSKGKEIPNAVELAINYTYKLIKKARKLKIGRGNGALPHFMGYIKNFKE